MECKCPLLLSRPGLHIELIDTLWNVNKSIKCAVSGSVLELIDTLWNVNCFSAFLFCFGAAELIETLWNVNIPVYSYIF